MQHRIYNSRFHHDLEELLQMVDRIDRGEEKLIPMDEDFMKRLTDLVDDVEEDDD